MATAKKLPSGNYRVRAYIGKDADGKPQYKSFTAPTKKEAEFLAAQFSAHHKEQTDCTLTLRTAAERYIESKRNVVSPSTVRGYKIILKNSAQDIMPIKIADITQEAIQISINKLAANHSPKTCRNVHGFISAVLRVYRPDFVLHTTLPKKEYNDIYVPDPEEVNEILQKVRGTLNEVPVYLAAECGMRASEIAALRIENVHEDHIRVKEAAVLDENNVEQIKSPKSFKSYRDIPITTEVSEYLILKSVNGRVCPRRAINVCNNWDKFRTKHKINENLNFHALRHHYASKLLLQGIPQKYIAELMGHSSTDMIEKVYQHIFPSAMEKFAEEIRNQMPPPQ